MSTSNQILLNQFDRVFNHLEQYFFSFSYLLSIYQKVIFKK